MSAFQQAYTVHKPLTAQDALEISRMAEAKLIEIQYNRIFGCIRDAAGNGNTSIISQEVVYPTNKDILLEYGYLISPYGEGWLKISWSSHNA